jgi:hypothetical protein
MAMSLPSKPISIYIGNELPQGCYPWSLLYPWHGFPAFLEERDIYLDYINNAERSYKPAPLRSCDLAVLPYSYLSPDHPSYQHQLMFIQDAVRIEKPVLVICGGDRYRRVREKNILVLRYELYKSRKKKYEFQIPQWTQDLAAQRDKSWPCTIKKAVKPKISFCGFSPPLSSDLDTTNHSQQIRHWLEQIPLVNNYFKPRFSFRVRAIQQLLNDQNVVCDFIIRDQFAFDQWGKLDLSTTSLNRIQFIENMYHSPYALCARGGANCSLRLYEALSCGRIPIIVDTDCVFPFEDVVCWSDYAIIVPQEKIRSIGSIIRKSHCEMLDSQFEARQIMCRQLWDEWVCPQGFYSKFVNVLRSFL